MAKLTDFSRLNDFNRFAHIDIDICVSKAEMGKVEDLESIFEAAPDFSGSDNVRLFPSSVSVCREMVLSRIA